MARTHLARRGALALTIALLSVPTVLVLGANAAVLPAASAMTTPVSPYELTLASAPVVAPGGIVSFVGICRDGTSDEATVRAVEIVGPEAEPFEFAVTVALNSTTGAFSGNIHVPGDAPNRTYRLELLCGGPGTPTVHDFQIITVDGPQITTTSSTPLRVERHVSEPSPAAPVPGQAVLTG